VHVLLSIRLKCLDFMRLEIRRVRSDLVETFKIINGKYGINSESFLEFDEGGRRGHSKKLFKRGPSWMLENFHLAIG